MSFCDFKLEGSAFTVIRNYEIEPLVVTAKRRPRRNVRSMDNGAAKANK